MALSNARMPSKMEGMGLVALWRLNLPESILITAMAVICTGLFVNSVVDARTANVRAARVRFLSRLGMSQAEALNHARLEQLLQSGMEARAASRAVKAWEESQGNARRGFFAAVAGYFFLGILLNARICWRLLWIARARRR